MGHHLPRVVSLVMDLDTCGRIGTVLYPAVHNNDSRTANLERSGIQLPNLLEDVTFKSDLQDSMPSKMPAL